MEIYSFLVFFFEKLNLKILFLLTIKFRTYEFQKKFQNVDIFSVSQLEKNDISGNKEKCRALFVVI